MPSEQVSALLMLLIVISASLIIYGYAVSVIESRTQTLNQIVSQEQFEQSQSLSKLFAYINDTNLVIAVYTGSNPVQIYRVYVNDTLQTGCTITFSNSTYTIAAEGYITVPSLTSAIITCPAPSDYLIFKVTYGGGALVGEAAKIS